MAENMAMDNLDISLDDSEETSGENLFLLAEVSSQVEYRLTCQWIYPGSSSPCGIAHENVDQLLSHIETSHCSDPGVCLWKFCSFTSAHPKEFECHLLFHGYHCFLKAKGEDFRNSNNLPICQLGSELMSRIVFPKIDSEEGWKCFWKLDKNTQCGLMFSCAKTYYDHVKKHFEGKMEWKCHWEGCSFESKTQWKLNDHVRSHTQERAIACPTCGTLFSNKSKFKDHLNRQITPASDSAHVCSICHKTFSTERLLCQHIRRHVNTHKCPYCEMTCASPSALTDHLHYKHTQGRPHQCPICPGRYKTHYALADHLKTHRDKEIKCDQAGCGYSTTTMRNYKHHLKTEHGDGTLTYCCHVCDQRFPQGNKLTSHLKTVHGFSLPPGHSRFRYIKGQDGLRRLQTVRLIDKSLSTSSTTAQ